MKKSFKLLAVLAVMVGMTLLVTPAFALGNYFLYGDFTTSGSAFLGGYDVDAYGNRIYVNRNGIDVDVYDVTLHDSDGDGNANEPDQHPSNPLATGPMESRTLSYVTTYRIPSIGTASMSEIYAASDRIYFADQNESISEYIFSGGAVNQVTSAFPYTTYRLSHIGRGSDGTWYGADESRVVYAYNGSSWDYQFSWAGFPGGNHGDGMEVVQDPNTGIDYVYVSDMYADYLGQWVFGDHDSNGTTPDEWFELQQFAYPGGGSSIAVEGMGFDALGHFWMTGSNHLYEVGGGDLGGYTGGSGGNEIPEPASMMLLGSGLLGLAGLRRKK